jgi:predicted nucleotidyltransferase
VQGLAAADEIGGEASPREVEGLLPIHFVGREVRDSRYYGPGSERTMHGIRRVAFFGSVLRDDFGADSDIDMLVEFEPQAQPGFEIVAIQEEFSEFFGGREVDFVNPKYISRFLKDEVLSTAEEIYAA